MGASAGVLSAGSGLVVGALLTWLTTTQSDGWPLTEYVPTTSPVMVVHRPTLGRKVFAQRAGPDKTQWIEKSAKMDPAASFPSYAQTSTVMTRGSPVGTGIPETVPLNVTQGHSTSRQLSSYRGKSTSLYSGFAFSSSTSLLSGSPGCL
jgi:hypothetical protein